MLASRAAIRVLFVEDEPGVFEDWIKWFRQKYSGHSDHVRSKEEAVSLVIDQAQEYDIAIVDMGILLNADSTTAADQNGLALIEAIGEQVPCVLCSGRIDPEYRRLAFKAQGFLEKPFTEGDLETVIEMVLGISDKPAEIW
jgi:DNA-binding NarL/FixJ family response regulator